MVAFMHVPRRLSLFNNLMMLTICPTFGSQIQSHRFQISCNSFERPKQWLRIQILNEEETGLNTVVYAKGRTKKENEHIKYNLTFISWHYRLTISVVNCDIPSLWSTGYIPMLQPLSPQGI